MIVLFSAMIVCKNNKNKFLEKILQTIRENNMKKN